MAVTVIGIQALKEKFFKEQFFYYKKFLSSAKTTDYMKDIIDYANKGDRGERLKSAELKIGTKSSILVTEEQMIASVDEFFEILSSSEHKEEIELVEKMMCYSGTEESFKDIIVEDKIYRSILQWFWTHMNDLGREEFERTGCEKSAKFRGLVEKQIFQQEGYTDAARIVTIISNMLGREYGKSYYYIAYFLEIRNHMRNYGAHELEKKLSLNQRVDAIKKVLFTYIATVLGLRDNLMCMQYLQQGYELCPISLCYLTVYNSRKDIVELINDEGFSVKGEELTPGAIKYNLQRSDNYKLQTANITLNIPKLYQCYSNPIAVCKYESIKLYASEREIGPEEKAITENILADVISKNITATEANTNATNANTSVLAGLIENIKDIKKSSRIIAVITIMIFVAIVGGLYYLNPSKEDNLNIVLSTENKSSNELVSLGDSLLKTALWKQDFNLCEHAGCIYREAISQLRILSEKQNYRASIELCHMYLSGKGCYDLDSALYYAQKKEVRATKEGQGLYAYILLRRGDIEQARREVSRAIDPQETYVRLTKTLYDIHNAINKPSSFQEAKQICENAYQSLQYLKNDDAVYEKAMLALWGIRYKEESNFMLHPNFGDAYDWLYSLARNYPYALLALGDIHNLMDDPVWGLNYHCAAYYCGIQQKAAIAINLSMLFNADTFKLTELGKEIKEEMAGRANIIGGVGGLLSDYVHYIDNKDFDLAVEAADSLSVLVHQEKTNLSINDSTFVPRIRITSRLMTGRPNDFSKAVQLAMKQDKCTDSVAVADYLKGVCLAKGYGCEINIIKSDELIFRSAKRGTYTESLVTHMKRNPPIFYQDGTARNWLDHYLNPSLLQKSHKLACSLMEVALKYSRQDQNAGQLVACLPSFLPKEMLLMNEVASTIQDFDKIPINNNATTFEMINDYICYALKNGHSYMAQVGCSVYRMFSDKYRVSQRKEVYDRFRYKQPTLPDSVDVNNIDIHNSKYALNLNPMPQYPDYAY